MPGAYDLHYEQLRSIITTDVHVDENTLDDTVVANTGTPLFQKHPYIERTLEKKQSFRSENTDEDIRTIKAMIINNFKLFKTLTESIQHVSDTQNQMALLLKECISITTDTNRILHEKSVESTPSNPNTPRGNQSGINTRPVLNKTPTCPTPLKRKIAISK